MSLSSPTYWGRPELQECGPEQAPCTCASVPSWLGSLCSERTNRVDGGLSSPLSCIYSVVPLFTGLLNHFVLTLCP